MWFDCLITFIYVLLFIFYYENIDNGIIWSIVNDLLFKKKIDFVIYKTESKCKKSWYENRDWSFIKVDNVNILFLRFWILNSSEILFLLLWYEYKNRDL